MVQNIKNINLLLVVIIMFCAKITIGQLTTTNLPPYNSPQHLIENVLLGKGVTAFNFQVYGAPIQYGFFSGGATSIGLDSGLVLNCEDINQLTIPPGLGGLIPNVGGNSGSFGPNSMGTATNNDLLSVANSVPGLIGQSFTVSSVNDAAVMEFDFVPLSDTIEFRYVFGSDEYTTFINTQYNDVFAFFLSGPGITGPYTSPPGFPGGSINLAVVPNSFPPLPITISTVQPGLNGAYYISNMPSLNVGLNGYTTVLTAKSAVTACDTFHIRLAVGDGTDHSLQSAVFLEAGSFNLGFDLGDDFLLANNTAICGNELNLTANIAATSYQWLKDGVIIPGATNQTYTANLGDGTYSCNITDANGCIGNDDVFLEFVTASLVNPLIPVFQLCDADGNLTENFNLTIKETEILGGQSPVDFEVEYFSDINYINQILFSCN